MKKHLLPLCFTLFSAAFLISTGMNSQAEENKTDKTVFVDLDGDGFNDSTTDFENVGKSSKFTRANNNAEDQSNQSGGGLISFNAKTDSKSDRVISKSEKFDRMKFSVRGLDQSRGESDSNFGGNPGNGIGSGKMNNACIGGICYE